MRAWELYTTPSVCPGCATGCNIEVQHSRGQVYRLVPRINPAVNKHWMCDEGRFTYKRTADRAPGRRRLSGGPPVDWDRALDDAGRALSAVLAATPDQVGVVFNAQSTNEDMYALARLAFDHLHVGKAYIAGLDQGWQRRHPGVGRQEPEHRGRDGDRRGPAAQPARSVERPEGGRGHGADRRRHARRAGRRGAARRRCRSTACRR